MVGYAVGLGNVWRFPYIVFKYGGGAFLLPYFIMVLAIGVPVFLIESGLGQFASQGPLKAFDCVRCFKGLGYAMWAISVLIGVYYNVVLGWVLHYIYQAASIFWTGEVPWANCNPDWTSDPNFCQGGVNSNFTVYNKTTDWQHACVQTPAELYFLKEIQGQPMINCTQDLTEATAEDGSFTESVFDIGQIYSRGAICLAITWIGIAFCIANGIKTSGKVMYVITLFPYVALTILLIKGLTLPGAMNGIYYYIKPNMSMVFTPEVWYEATGQIFYSTSLAMGGVITLTSFNGFRNNLVKDAVTVVLADAGTSIYGGFVIFAFLGYMAEISGKTIEDVVIAGPGLTFIVWPEAMTKMSDNNYVCAGFSVVFFVMLYFMGVSSMIGLTETVITFILDLFPALKKKRGYVVAGTVVTLFLVAFPMVCTNGSHFFNTWDAFAAAYTLIILALFEVIAISWIYGTKRFINDIRMMTGRILPSWVELSLEWIWKVVAPVVLVYLLINKIVTPGSTNEYQVYGKTFKLENTGYIGYTLLAIPLALIIGGFALKVKKYGLDAKTLLEPTEKWGPAKRDDRINHQHERDDEVTYVPPEEEKSTMLSEM